MPDRFPVEVTMSECRAIARALDLAAFMIECCDDEETNPERLRNLAARFGNAEAIERLSHMLSEARPE